MALMGLRFGVGTVGACTYRHEAENALLGVVYEGAFLCCIAWAI